MTSSTGRLGVVKAGLRKGGAVALLEICGVKTEARGSCGKGFDDGVPGKLAKGFGLLEALDGELRPPV